MGQSRFEGAIRVAVVGGTGTVGGFVVEELVRRGHDVRILSRRAPATRTARHDRVDLTSGEGLAEALADVRTVVDASNARLPGMGRPRKVLLDGTRHLLDAETEAGVEHHVLISIVGIDDVPFAYYRAKVSQEQTVIARSIPWTIVRATQFHPLLDELFRSFARLGVLPRSPIPLQPIAPREAATVLADSVEEGPRGGKREIAGPEISTVTDLARTWMRANARSRLLIPPPIFAGIRRALSRGALTAPDAERAGPTFDRWLREDGG